MPPKRGQKGAARVGRHVPPIARGAGNDRGADPFAQHRPENQVTKDLAGGGRAIVSAQTPAPVQRQHRRQSAGNQQQIVEPGMEKRQVCARLQSPTIEWIERARPEKQGIRVVPKPPHSRASMMNPAAVATAIFSRIVVMAHR